MSGAQDYSYIGSGKVYVKEYGAAAARVEVGNCSSLTFNVSETEKSLVDHTKPGGGTRNEVRRIESCEAALTLTDLSPDNLARVLFGGTSAVVSAAVTDELQVGYKDSFIPFTFLPDATPPTVKASSGDGAASRANSTAYTLGQFYIPATPNGYFYKITTAGTSAASPPTFGTAVGGTTADGTATITNMGLVTLVADTDYEVRPGGIYILEGARFTDGQTLKIGYTKTAADIVQALISSAKDYELVFDGLNEARSGKSTRITVYKLKIGAASNVALIGDDYATLPVSGKVQQDTTKTGVGISQYFRVDIAR